MATLEKWLFNYALSLALSGVSGVRAFLPTFIISIVAIARPDLVDLSPSMKWVKHPAAAAASGLLAVGEIVCNEIPCIDNIFHLVMSFVHPIMGFVNALAPNLFEAEASVRAMTWQPKREERAHAHPSHPPV